MSVDISTLSVEVRSTGVRETADGLNKIFQEAKKAEDRVVTLTAKIEKLSQAFQQGSASAQAYQQAVANANRTTGAHSTATGSLNAIMQTLVNSLNALNSNLSTLQNRTRQSTEAITFHTAALQDAHAAARGLSGALGALWVTYGNMIPLAAGLAIGASFKQIVAIGKDVENTLEGIRVKGQESMESVAAMRASLLDLGKGLYGPKEVAKAYETLILAGKSAKEAMVGVADAMNLATIGGTTVEKAAYTLVQVSTSLGMTANGFGRVADVIAATAAASMSSVESISEAFKSGSSVAKLYGVSLVDIGTSFAALSNLGIQGSAAGTALKNFYKELASEGKKVVDTFKDMGLAQKDLKDIHGNFLPLAQLLPKLSDALAQYSEAEQQIIKNRLANERGLRMLVEVLDLYREKGQEAATAFEELQKRIEDSYGFTAVGAAAMALTVENQFKSVKNTLDTTFVKAFQDLQPQMSVLAQTLKQAFSSPEFIGAIKSVATALADMAVWVVDNTGFLKVLLEVFLAYKAISFVIGLVTSIGEGLIAMKVALDAAKISAIAFQASLGILGLGLAAVALGLTYYMTKKKEVAESSESRAALAYVDNFTEALKSEADRLETQISLMRKGKTEAEAYTEALRERNLEMLKAQNQKNVDSKLEVVENLKGGLTASQLRTYSRAKLLGAEAIQLAPEVNAVLKAERDYTSAVAESNRKNAEAANEVKRVVELSKEKASLAEREASKVTPHGDKTLAGKPDKSAINDAYAAELTRIEGEVQAAKRALNFTIKENEAAMKQGEIGRFEMIERNSQAAIALYEKEIEAYNRAVDLAAPANRKAKKAELANKISAAEDGLANERLKAQEQEGVRMVELDKFVTQERIKEAEARGQHVLAAELKYGEQNRVAQMQIAKDIEFTTGAIMKATDDKEREALEKRLAGLVSAQKAINDVVKSTTAAGRFKEAEEQYTASFNALKAGIEELDEKAAAHSGWLGRLFAADEVEALKNEKIPELIKELNQLHDAAFSEGGTAKDKTLYEQKYREFLKFTHKQNTTYKEALKEIDQIGMEGFEALFSNVSGAWSNYVGKMKADFKKLLIDELYKMVARPIVLQVVASIAGVTGFSGFANAAMKEAGSGAVGSIGTAASIASLFGSGGLSGALAGGAGWLTGATSFSGAMSAAGSLIGTGSAAGISSGLAVGAGALAPIVIGGIVAKTLYDHFQGESRSGGGYDVINGKTVLGGGPDGGEIQGTQTRATIDAAYTALTGMLSSLGSSSKLTRFTAGLESSTQGKGATFAGGVLDGSIFGSTYETTKYNQTLSPEEAVKQFNQKLNQAVLFALQKAADVPTTIKEQLDKADIANLTTEAASSLVQSIQSEVASVKAFQDAVQYLPFENLKKLSFDAADGLLKVVGGMDKWQSSIATFVDKFYTADEKIAKVSEGVNKALADLGMGDVTTKMMFRDKVNSLDLTTESGQKLYKSLMDLAPAFAEVADNAEEVAKKQLENTKKLQEEASKLQTTIYNGAMNDITNALGKLSKSVDVEKKRITDDYDAQIEALKKKADDDVEAKKKELKVAEDAQNEIGKVFDALSNALKTTEIDSASLLEARRKEAMDLLNRAQMFANGGGNISKFDGLENALQVISKPSEQLYTTFEDYARAQAVTSNTINGLLSTAKAQKDAAQLTIDAINGTIDTIKATSDTQVKTLEAARDAETSRLDKMVEAAQLQADRLKGIDSSIISLADAIRQFNTSIQAGHATTLGNSASAILSAYQDNLYRAPDTAGLNFWQDQVSSGVPITKVVDDIKNSNEAKVQQLYTSTLGRVGEYEGVNYWMNQLASGKSLDEVKTDFLASAQAVSQTTGYQNDLANGVYRITDQTKNGMPSFDVGTNEVPYDMVAQIHAGERIIPAADNAELMRRLSDEDSKQAAQDLAQAVADLKQCIISGDVANVQQAKELYKLFKRWDGDGLPATRST